MTSLLLSGFATYSITLVLTSSDGPLGIFARLRKHLTALQCFLCTSVWVGALIALYTSNSPAEWLIFTFGLSGGAVFINYITMGREW
jgi:uncharacterized protein DUF1360